MDFLIGGVIVANDYKPKWTCWTHKTVKLHKDQHKRKARRLYKHYLKTGCISDYNRSQYLMTRKDFD
jgi:hypothetical protein